MRAAGEPPVAQFLSLACAEQYAHLYSLTSRHVAPGATVLDWGCGNGHFSYHLARLGMRVVAFSFWSEPAVFERLAPEERARIAFVQGGHHPTRLPFEDARFDHVFSVGVLEHVRETGGDEAASLSEIRRVLRPGGSFICCHLPNRLSWIEALNRLLHSGSPLRDGELAYHAWRYDRAQIRALCAGAGLTPIELRTYGVLPRNPLMALPPSLRDSRLIAGAWNAIDLLTEWPLGPFAQNISFVATA